MQKIRAFLVEDSPLVVEILTRTLKDASNIEVLGSAPDEQAALEWLDAHAGGCDVLIVDVHLKHGNGLKVLERLRFNAVPPRRAVLTSYPSADVKQQARAMGASAVFDKATGLAPLVRWVQGVESSAA